VQAAKAPKGSEGAPFPVKVLLELGQPADCCGWDVEWLKVLLVVEGPELGADAEALPLRVEFPQTDLPEDLRALMADVTLDHWRAAVAGAADGPRWRLQETLSWVSAHFDFLLRLMPECVDWYMGADANDVSMRRYTITPQVEVQITKVPTLKTKVAVKTGDSDDAEGEGAGEERLAERARQKAQEQQREEEEARRGADRRRDEAMAARERGEVVLKVPQLSKKELEEKRKSKQGCRTSKTGPKASKFAGEGSAIEKAKSATGGKKKK
jgi:hypothetical protein